MRHGINISQFSHNADIYNLVLSSWRRSGFHLDKHTQSVQEILSESFIYFSMASLSG